MASPIDNIIAAESGGNPQASNPNSSALGAGQFLAGTWLDTLAKHRPDITGSQDELLALRNDPVLSKQMTEAYAADNADILSKSGLPVSNGSLYLAHFAGPGGAIKVLQADPSASVEDVLGAGVVKANPFLKGMTTQDLQAWAAKKMGTVLPSAGVQTSPQAPSASPANAIPQPSLPILPVQAQQAAQPAISPLALQTPDIQAPPIFFAPRRPINLAALQQAIRPPVFPRG